MTELTEEQKDMLKKTEACPKFGIEVDGAAILETAKKLGQQIQVPE